MKTLEQLGNACKQASRQIMNADRNQKDALLRGNRKAIGTGYARYPQSECPRC